MRRLALALSGLSLGALLTGCSAVHEYRAPAGVRDGARMQTATERASSRVLEMIGLKGKVTRGRATPLDCSGYEPEGRVRQNRHPWSVYGVPFAELEKAYRGLRTALPAHGWEIVEDGPDSSRARTPTLVANSRDGEFSVRVSLMDRRAKKDSESLIHVTVVSRCYEVPPSAAP
ncbi:hypothetical protein [Streptomyces sp. NPDC050856]|uniref:hypothetical protein n=1 Tax=Streptomyces sp. NPDC050856 TaxID=3154939 RepID=UPI0033F0F281